MTRCAPRPSRLARASDRVRARSAGCGRARRPAAPSALSTSARQLLGGDHGVDDAVRGEVLRGLHAGRERPPVQRLVDLRPEEADERPGLGDGHVRRASPTRRRRRRWSGAAGRRGRAGRRPGGPSAPGRSSTICDEGGRALLHAGAAGRGGRQQRMPSAVARRTAATIRSAAARPIDPARKRNSLTTTATGRPRTRPRPVSTDSSVPAFARPPRRARPVGSARPDDGRSAASHDSKEPGSRTRSSSSPRRVQRRGSLPVVLVEPGADRRRRAGRGAAARRGRGAGHLARRRRRRTAAAGRAGSAARASGARRRPAAPGSRSGPTRRPRRGCAPCRPGRRPRRAGRAAARRPSRRRPPRRPR